MKSTLLSELYELIKSLTKSEKRYFNLYSKFQTGNKSYLFLFELIDGMKIFDEKKIKQQFTSKYKSNNFPAIKQYLFQQLISALRAFGAYKDLDSDHTDLIETYKVLHYKGLHGQSAKLLKKIKAITLSDDAFIRHYYVLLQDYLQEIYHPEDAEASRIKEIFEERKKVLKIIQNYSWVGDIYTLQRIFLRNKLYCRNASDKAALRKIVTPLLKTTEKDMLSRTALGMRNMALCDYFTAIGQSGKAFETSRIYLELRKNAGSADKVDTQTIAEYAQHLWLAIRAEKYDDFDIHLHKYKSFVDQIINHDKHALAYERWFLYSFIRFCRLGKFEEAMAQMEKESKQLKQYESSFTMKGKIALWYFQAYNCFARKDYRKSLSLIQKIQLDANDAVEEFSFSKLLMMFIQYELGNMELLEYQVKSAQRYMTKKGRLYKCESALLNFFKSVHGNETNKLLQTKLTSLQDEISALLRSPHERGFIFYFDIESWIESRRTGQKFPAIIQERVEKFNHISEPK